MTAPNKFAFDTIKDFDGHINNSIYGYNLLHELVVNISSFYIRDNDTRPVVDLGCTSGALLKMIGERFPKVARIGYDITDHNFLDGEDLRVQDITSPSFVVPSAQIVYSIFTAQFLPFEKRLPLLRSIYEALDYTGAFIFCEKEFAESARFQEIYTFANYQNKAKSFTSDEILAKERDIRAIMSPVNHSRNLELLREAGFRDVDIFFKSLNFTGYICTK